jgi:hypothetical protein
MQFDTDDDEIELPEGWGNKLTSSFKKYYYKRVVYCVL